ncbi:MAG: hypothetical protein WB646_05815 [Steroidobacteraceae bacterium]
MSSEIGIALGIVIAAIVLAAIIWQVRSSRPRRKGASSTNA